MTAMHFGGAYRCVCGEVVRWSSSVAKHKRQCKSYQEYVEINGELMDKVCNIIEVQYSEEMHEQSSETECGNQDGTQLAENNVEHDGHNQQDGTQLTKNCVEQDGTQLAENSVEQDDQSITSDGNLNFKYEQIP